MVYVHEGMNFESLRSTAKASGVLLRGGVSVAQFHTFLNFSQWAHVAFIFMGERTYVFIIRE